VFAYSVEVFSCCTASWDSMTSSALTLVTALDARVSKARAKTRKDKGDLSRDGR
jgi:hypothetical protein